LSIDPVSGVLSGTPTNAEVGIYQVNVSISDGHGGIDFSNFTLTVKNVDPHILSADVVSVKEDSEYFVHYQSDDDGSGTITWSLETIAKWPSLDPKEGIINGTPDNSMVGKYDVKVTVDDGNGGTDSRTFVLTVVNTPPVITTVPITGVTQDQKYLVDFNSTDDGQGIIYWTMSNVPAWLTLDHDSGVLTGTPGNKEVGEYQINITVSDGNGGTASEEYTLIVLNVDDPAIWTRVPKDTVLEKGAVYTFDVDAIDPDIGVDNVFGISSTPASSIKIDAKTGTINWVTTDYGRYKVTISFGDKKSSIYYNFIIKVNTPPKVTLASPLNGTEVDQVNPTFQWSVIDDDGDNVTSTLYYGTDEAGVRAHISQYLIGGLKDTYYVPVLFLDKAKRYYWTVVPDDGRITGDCTSGVWSFTVKANASANTPPRFTSTPDLDAKVGVQWTYQPTAVDDDAMDQASITLVSGPDGISLDAGVLHWVPRVDQVGIYKVKLQVTDGKSSIYQEFSIVVSKASTTNHPPIIDKVGPITVKEGDTVSVKVIGTDIDGDTVRFELVSGPTGISISEEGQLVWATKKGDAGGYDVVVRASDGLAQNTTQLHITVKKVEKHGALSLASVFPFILVAIVVIVIMILLVVIRMRKGTVTAEEQAVESIPPKASPALAPVHKAALTESAPESGNERKKKVAKPKTVKEKVPAPEKAPPEVPPKETGTATGQEVSVVETVDVGDLENE
jgi:hypothetical protein